jgi:hypothetical protein
MSAVQPGLLAVQVELDELYAVQKKNFEKYPPFPEKNPNYCQKTPEKAQNFNKTYNDSPNKRSKQKKTSVQIDLDELYAVQTSADGFEKIFLDIITN